MNRGWMDCPKCGSADWRKEAKDNRYYLICNECGFKILDFVNDFMVSPKRREK